MSKSKKIWLGIFTFAPLIVTILAIIAFIGTFISLFSAISNQEIAGDVQPSLLFSGVFVFFILFLLASLADLAITIYYIDYIVRDEKVDETEKIIWALALFFGSFISTAVYWVVRIWNRKEGGNFRTIQNDKIVDL